MFEAEVVDAQNPHPQRDFGADGVEVGVEGFLRNGEVGQAHRNHAATAPYKEGQRLLQGDDLQSACIG